jgi:hypothetical protein
MNSAATGSSNNVAVGNQTLGLGANRSVAIGSLAGYRMSGSDNVAIGHQAGSSTNTGNNDIYIGSGVDSFTESNTLRLGNGLTRAFVSGIRGTTTGNFDAVSVLIDSAGQLGTISSSARFKQDIEDMGDASSNLLRLRPVTFRYRQPASDGSRPLQHGLIAEEVAEIYPDLVVRGADGQVETVQYWKIDVMLLNEVQKQQAVIARQAEEIESLRKRLESLEAVVLH